MWSVRNKDSRKCACVGGTLTLSTPQKKGMYVIKTLNIYTLYSLPRFFGLEKKTMEKNACQDALGLL